jgi:hypothetical protein
MKHEFKDGFLATIPISFSIVSFGLVCGALSVQNGMSLSELLLMNVFVFGGAGQFLMVEMWDAPRYIGYFNGCPINQSPLFSHVYGASSLVCQLSDDRKAGVHPFDSRTQLGLESLPP